MDEHAKKIFLLNLIYGLTIAFFVFFTLKFLFSYLLPFIIASIIAWLVQKPANYVSKKLNFNKGVCAAILSILFYITVMTVFSLLIYNFIIALKSFLGDVPSFLQPIKNIVVSIQNRLDTVLNGISDNLANEMNIIFQNTLEVIGNKITDFLSNIATRLAGGLPSFLFSGIVTLVAGCYVAKDFDRLSRFLKELFGKRIYKNIIKIKDIFTNSIFKLIKGYILLMLITFLELTIAFFLLNIKYPLILALAVSFIDLLPVFGIGTVLLPWSIVEFVRLNSKMGIAILAIYILVIIARNFLEPKIIGKQIGINPLFTLIAMFTGLKIFGFWGLFLAPIIFIVAIKYYKKEMEEEKNAIA